MPDKPDPKDLEALMTRIMTKRPESPELQESQDQDQGQERVIEAEKILLRDEAGKSRGKISANADGSASLILSHSEGSAWAWLGVNREGEAFLELKDKTGEFRFKVPVGPPAPGVTEGSLAAPISVPSPDPASEPAGSQITSQATSDAGVTAPGGGLDRSPLPPVMSSGLKPGYVDTTVYDRLEELERKNRGRGFFRAALLGLIAVILGVQAFLLMRPPFPKGPLEVESLVLRDQTGTLRAWLGAKDGNPALDLRDRQGRLRAALGLGADGSPALVLYDEGQRVRAGLHLGLNGDPRLDLRDKASLLGQTERHTANDTGNQQSQTVSDPGDEDGTMVGPVSGAEDVSQVREAAVETIYVGSKTSNKYHYPTCKWAKTINPSRLIKFKSVAEAQKRHYLPCPVCKPPPLSK